MKYNYIKTISHCIFLLLLISFASCKKENKDGDPVKLKVEGNIKETQTLLPLNKVVVKIFHYGGGGGSFGKTSYTIIGETLTDVNGNYHIEGNTTYGERLFVRIVDNNHRSIRDYECLVKDDYLRHDVNLDIPGYVKVIFKNKFPADSVVLTYKVDATNYLKYVAGKFMFDDYVFATSALKGIKVYYTVYRKKVLTKYIDSVDVPLRDTVVFQADF